MELVARFQAAKAELGLSDDPAQSRAVQVLDRVGRELAARPDRRMPRLLRRFLPGRPASIPVRGA